MGGGRQDEAGAVILMWLRGVAGVSQGIVVVQTMCSVYCLF